MTQWNRHRHDNTIRVAEALWRGAGLSRAALARRLRLDRSTVGSCVDELISMGLVHEAERGEGGPEGGRPPVLLSLHHGYGYSIGIDVTDDRVVLSANDLSGATLLRREDRHEAAGSSAPGAGAYPSGAAMPGGGTAAGGTAGGGTAEGAALTTALISRIADLRKAMAEMGHHRLLAVAIGVSGMVDTSRGEILLSRTLGIRRPTPIGAPVQDAVGVPVWIFNDADASAIGELEYGRREGDRGEAAPSEEAGRYGQGADPAAARDLLFVLVRYKAPPRLADARLNAGLGIVLDERLREAYAGGGREFRSPFVDARSSEQFAVAERTRRGEFAIRRELEAAFADELGLAVSFLVHALDLRNVVLGGDVLRDGVPYEVFDAAIRHHVSSSTARIEPQPLELRRPVAGDRAVAFGAAAAAVRRLFRHRLFPLDTDAPLVREKV